LSPENTVNALMWCILELNLSIIGGNIPAIKPVLQQLFPRLLGSSARNKSGYPSAGMYGLSSSKKGRTHLASTSSTMGGKGGKHVVGIQSALRSHSGSRGMDNNSEEYIMSDNPHITKTIEYGYEVTGSDEDRMSMRKKDIGLGV
jgi:hypothetical protein